MLPKIKDNALVITQGVIFAGFIALSLAIYIKTSTFQGQLDSLKDTESVFKMNFEEYLFEDHLKVEESFRLQGQINSLESELAELAAVPDNQVFIQVQEVYSLYSDFKGRLSRNKQVEIDVSSYEDVSILAELLLEKNYDEMKTSINKSLESMEKDYQEYLASLPPPPPPPSSGYSYQTVNTERGTFGVYLIKMPLSEVKVVTASASDSDCSDNCPTKSLADHVKDNGGFAGMNGAYFCPPDYSSCGGKVNSTDYAFYKSSSGKWFNKDALSWQDTGLATFNGHDSKFYRESSSYGGKSVTAAVSNYPTLLKDGEVKIKEHTLSSYQKDSKGLRGVIGRGGTNLYLGVVTNATVIDAAYAMKALGCRDALNLDGGGSSAMYMNGSYVVGPGRSLPSAIVLTK